MEDKAKHIDTSLTIANSLRFKLWATVGEDESKKRNIVKYLEQQGYIEINVGKELSSISNRLVRVQSHYMT